MAIKATVQKKRYDENQIREGVVRIGFFEDKKYEEKKDKNGKVIRKAIHVAQVAHWNEYGTGGAHGIPERPFMRPSVFAHKQVLQEILRARYRRAFKNNENTMRVLKLFGEEVVEIIKTQIDSVNTPENAPITIDGGWLGRKGKKSVYIEGKGGSKPLYDTGFMENSVDYKAEEVFK